MKRILRAAEGYGWLLALAAVVLFAFAYFVARPPVEDAIDTSPSIPEELADHQTRGDMERGRSTGATPNTAFPRYSEAQFIASPNWSSRGTCGVEGIVLHVTGPGTLAGMDSWFKNPASQVSATFGIDKNGTVHQYVEVGDAAWHAGIVNKPDLTNAWIAGLVSQGVNPNRCTVGIELVLAGPAEPLSDYPQMQASLDRLLTWLNTTTNVSLSRQRVVGHYQFDSISRSTDPVCCVSIDKVLAGLNPAPVSEWTACDPSWGGRYSEYIKKWLHWGEGYFPDASGAWAYAPAC